MYKYSNNIRNQRVEQRAATSYSREKCIVEEALSKNVLFDRVRVVRIRCHRIFRALLARNFLPSEFSRLERVVADASEYKYTRVVSKNREIYRVHGTARSLLAVTCEGFNVFMIDLF